MSKTFSRVVLLKWISTVADTNLTFFANRTKLFDQLVALSKLHADEIKDNCTLPLSTFGKLKQFLTARNDQLAKNDNIQLSFTKTIEELTKELENRSDGDEQSSFSLQLTPFVEAKAEVRQ